MVERIIIKEFVLMRPPDTLTELDKNKKLKALKVKFSIEHLEIKRLLLF